MQDLTLTLVQTHTHWHDPAANRAHFGVLLESVDAPGDLVVLPEMFSTGFTMASDRQAETMDGPTVRWMHESASALGAPLCGSVVIREGEACFNRFVCAFPDGRQVTYDKRHLFRMAGEHEHYQSGANRCVFKLGDWHICPQICYDLRFPVFCRNQHDYDLLLFVANWPAARVGQWRALLAARAIENLACVAGVNVVGTDGNGVEYAGGSGAWMADGSIAADLGADAVVQQVRFDGAALVEWRERFPAWMDADRFDLL